MYTYNIYYNLQYNIYDKVCICIYIYTYVYIHPVVDSIYMYIRYSPCLGLVCSIISCWCRAVFSGGGKPLKIEKTNFL